MIPRTVQMAAAVAAQFTSTELADYGNVILNGYDDTEPNTTGELAWQYKETTTAPVPLPSVQHWYPAYKGWTTNYMQYYTQLPPNAYGVYPGAPTMFDYVVHSFGSNGGEAHYAQPPHRMFQNQVLPSSPNQTINNPAVIQYSFIYPVADNPVPPPVDIL